MGSVVGMEISASAVRAVEVKGGHTAHPAVVRAYAVDLPDGVANDGEVLNTDLFQIALDNLWSKGKFASRNVALCVGNRQSVVRQLTLPYLPGKQFAQALPFQAEQFLSASADDLLLDFYPQELHEGEEPEVSGLLTAVSKTTVEKNIAVLKSAKLNVLHADLLPYAVSRLEHLAEARSGGRLQVTLSADTSYISLVTGKVTEVIRVVALGTSDIAAAVEERVDGDPLTAMRSIGVLGGDDYEEEEIAGTIRAEVTVLTDAIRSTIEYVRSMNEGAAGIEEIVLVGNARHIAGLGRRITEAVGVRARYSDAITKLTQGKSLELGSSVAEFAAATGVAIEGGK